MGKTRTKRTRKSPIKLYSTKKKEENRISMIINFVYIPPFLPLHNWLKHWILFFLYVYLLKMKIYECCRYFLFFFFFYDRLLILFDFLPLLSYFGFVRYTLKTIVREFM